MAYNEKLANRLRKRLVDHPNIVEKEMMGGFYTIKNKSSLIGFGADYTLGKSLLH